MKLRLAWTRPLVATAAAAMVLVAASIQPVAAAHRNEGQLVFLDKPASTGTGMPVLASSGGPLRVAVIDRHGERVRQAGVKVRLVLAGTTGCISHNVKRTRPSGVARFRPRISCQGAGHRLRARHIVTPTIPHVHKSKFSTAFDVLEATLCGDTCQATAALGGTEVRVTSATGSRVMLGLGGAADDCPGYAETSEPVTFGVSESTTRTTVRFSIPYSGRSASAYQVCFSSPESTFRDRSGATIAKGEAGLLRDCYGSHHADGDTERSVRTGTFVDVDADPCVVARFKKDGMVVVIFSVPPGDPRGVI